MSDKEMNILFVCTGNTCRSCMAEDIFRRKVREKNLEEKFEVSSAGITALEGKSASEEAKVVVKENGGDLSFHKSRKVTTQMLEKADFIFTMTLSHKKNVVEMLPQAYNKVHIIKEFVDSKIEKESLELAELYKRAAYLHNNIYGQLNEIGEEKDNHEIKEELYEVERQIKEMEVKFINYDISDPFGGSIKEYENIYQELDSSIEDILEKLKNKL